MILLNEVIKYVDNLIPNEYNTSIDDVHADLIKMGLHKMGHSTANGGLGLSLKAQCMINIELARTRLCFRNRVGYTSSLVSYAIDNYADKELATDCFNDINKGEIYSFALTEPKSGSSTMDMKSIYFENDGQYFLTGNKNFIGNATIATKFLIFALNKKRTISAFIVDADKIIVDTPLDKMGQDGIDVSNIHFSLAEGRLLGREGEGAAILKKALERSRLITGTVALGMVTRAVEYAITFAKERRTYRHQLVQALIADSFTEALALKGMLNLVLDDRSSPNASSSALKLFAGKTVNSVLDNCVQIMGGYGIIKNNIVEEFYRDARVFRIYEGTDQIQQMNIARGLLR